MTITEPAEFALQAFNLTVALGYFVTAAKLWGRLWVNYGSSLAPAKLTLSITCILFGVGRFSRLADGYANTEAFWRIAAYSTGHVFLIISIWMILLRTKARIDAG